MTTSVSLDILDSVLYEQSVPKRFAHINFTPPKAAQAAAKRGLELRKEHGRGGTSVGVASARMLASGQWPWSRTSRMFTFFARHGATARLDRDGKSGRPISNSYIAWQLWGGEPGRRWITRVWKQMKAANVAGKEKK